MKFGEEWDTDSEVCKFFSISISSFSAVSKASTSSFADSAGSVIEEISKKKYNRTQH